MEGDVVISSPESDSCEVTYNGNKIADVPMGARVTIHTEGKQMEDDIVIEVVNSTLALDSPTISLDGNILTITDESGLAEEFDIIVDGEVKATNMSTTFDLSTLGLPEGTHSITVKARASGYKDSDESNAVSYLVESEVEETYTLSGTYVFDEIIDAFEDISQEIDFISNGRLYDHLRGGVPYHDTGTSLCYYVDSEDDYDTAYYIYGEEQDWSSEAYRTITFNGEQTVSKEFYDWFTANATEVTVSTKSLNINVTDNEWGNVAYFIDKYHMGNNADGKTNGIGSTNLHNIKDFVVLTNDEDFSLKIESYKNCSIYDTWAYTLVYNIQNDASITLYTDD
jgi:hypothetical protein